MVGLNVGQAKVKFSQMWSQVFPVYLQIGEAVTPPLVKIPADFDASGTRLGALARSLWCNNDQSC